MLRAGRRRMRYHSLMRVYDGNLGILAAHDRNRPTGAFLPDSPSGEQHFQVTAM